MPGDDDADRPDAQQQCFIALRQARRVATKDDREDAVKEAEKLCEDAAKDEADRREDAAKAAADRQDDEVEAQADRRDDLRDDDDE